jgi:hypothetical protein
VEVIFDKNGITFECPQHLEQEIRIYQCKGCRHFGGLNAFIVTCWRNHRFNEQYNKAAE